jgi:hypothetical protein
MDRAYTSCEMKARGVSRMAGMFGWNLLVATTENGEVLLYTVPLKGDVNQPVWEERINAGRDTKNTIQIMALT